MKAGLRTLAGVLALAGTLCAATDPIGGATQAAQKLLDEGRFAEGEAAARELLPRIEAESGSTSPAVADILEILVTAMVRQGNSAQPEALAAAQRAVAIREATVGPDHADMARSLMVQANVYLRRRDLATARIHFQRAVAIQEKALGANHSLTGEGLARLAVVEADLGNSFTARDMLRRALAILEITPGYEERKLTGPLTNLATVLQDIGDFEGARAVYERALEMTERTYGPEHPFTADTLGNFGIDPEIAGSVERSESMLRRALEIREKKLGPDHFLIAASLLNLANILALKADYDGANPLYQRALRIAEARVGPEHQLTASILDGLGDALWYQGEVEPARAAVERAVGIFEARLGPHHYKTAISRITLTRIAFPGGENLRSLDEGLAVAGQVQATLEQVAQVASEREALRYAAVQASGLDLALSVLSEPSADRAAAPADVKRVWEALLRSRALVLDEMVMRNRLRHEAALPELAPLIGALDEARGKLAKLLAQGPEPDRLEVFKAAVEEALAGAERAERTVIEKSGSFRMDHSRVNASFDDVARALPAGSALLAFARYERSRRGEPRREPAYIALVLPSGGKPPFARPLGPADRIDLLVSRWRKEAGQAPSDPEAVARYHEAGIELRQAIWDPVKERLGEPRLVFVVPDGDLNLVSFGALPVSPDRYLIESSALIHYLSTERDLLTEPAGGEHRGLLLLGGADFNSIPGARAEEAPPKTAMASPPGAPLRRGLEGCDPLRRLTFETLPSSKEEVEEVRAIWARATKARSQEDSILLLSGGQAAEGELKRNAPGRRVVHLATHGFWMSDLCAPEAARPSVLPPTGGMQPAFRAPAKNALMVAGLALAGANRRYDASATPEAEDGILTAEEIASLDLRGVEWVVLSACETAVGPVLRGEGVFGLRRAFQVAGAETLIISLWPVGDHDTREWMRALYEARFAGDPTAEAMRRASRDILAARRKAGVTTHPYFWGAFMAVGGWK